VWDFYEVGKGKFMIDPGCEGGRIRVACGLSGEMREVDPVRIGCRDDGALNRQDACLSEEYELSGITGERDRAAAFEMLQNDVLAAKAYHRSRDAGTVATVKVVRIEDLANPDWWLGRVFQTAVSFPAEKMKVVTGGFVPPGAESLAGKWGTVVHAFTADPAESGDDYVSVRVGESLFFVTDAGAVQYEDGAVEAVVLVRVGRRTFVYGYVPLWVVASPDAYIGPAAKACRRKRAGAGVRIEEPSSASGDFNEDNRARSIIVD